MYTIVPYIAIHYRGRVYYYTSGIVCVLLYVSNTLLEREIFEAFIFRGMASIVAQYSWNGCMLTGATPLITL